MAMNATITACWHDAVNVYLTAVAAELEGPTEYQASTPLRDAQGNLKPNATLRSELIANMSAARTAQRTPPPAVPISGVITLP